MSPDLLDRHRVLRLLLYLITLVVALYAAGLIWALITRFGGIILLFFLAWVVSFTLQPLSAFLQRWRLPRIVAVTLIYVSLLTVVSGGIILAIPVIHDQVGHVAAELTVALAPANLQSLADQTAAYLHTLGLSVKDSRALVTQVSGQIPGWISTLTNQAVVTTGQSVGAVMEILFDAVIVMILSFYMMLDGDRLLEDWVQRLPPTWMPDIRLLQRNIDVIFGGFLRAQLIIAIVYCALNWAILLWLGQRNGLVFALLAGLLMLIPFLGPFLAVVPPVLLVMLQTDTHDLVIKLMILGVTLFIAQQITMQIIAPRVMSAHVGLHPLLLFAALLVGAQEGGIWGAVFAGPIAAVVIVMCDVFFQRFQASSRLYPDVPRDSQRTADEVEVGMGERERNGALLR